MAAPGVLVINEAKWGPISRDTEPIIVTDIVTRLANERGAGHFLFVSRYDDKGALFGNVSKQDKELSIRYTYNNAPQTETFHQNQDVLIGDEELYWQSLSDTYGYLDDTIADALLFRHRPILRLHPEETSYPCRVDWYVQRCALYCQVGLQSTRVLEKVKDPADLIRTIPSSNYTFKSTEKRRCFLKHIDTPSTQNGEGIANLSSCPYYCTATVTEDGDICLTYAMPAHADYFFFYAFNGAAMENPLVPASVRRVTGTHQGDWEYVAIRVSPDGEEIRAVHMSRHAGSEGKWYLSMAPNAQRDVGWHVDPVRGRVVVYAGKETHANYNISGRQDRGHGGFVDDRTGDGPVWDPEYTVNLGSLARPRLPWVRYGGLWGKAQESKLEGEGPEGPGLKTVFRGIGYPMKNDNCIPPFGPWFAQLKKDSDAKIEAAGKSLIKKKTVVAPALVPQLSSADFSYRSFPISTSPMSAPPGSPQPQLTPSPPAVSPRSFSVGATDMPQLNDPTGRAMSVSMGTPSRRSDMLDSNAIVGPQKLEHDTCITSPNDEYRLWMQNDGDLVLYQRANGGKIVWRAGTRGKGAAPWTLACQGDGNVVIYDGNNVPRWKTDSFQKAAQPPYHLLVQNDRNIVLYDRSMRPVWQSYTNRDGGYDTGKLLK